MPSAYKTSTPGLSALTRQLVYGLKRLGVRVDQTNPGWVATQTKMLNYHGKVIVIDLLAAIACGDYRETLIGFALIHRH